MKKILLAIIAPMLLLFATITPVAETINKTATTGDVVIWSHLPDTSGNGIDIRCDRADGVKRTLATDFECTITGPITQVILYGSWKNDIEGTITLIHLSIHDDIPASTSPTGYSMPGDLRWKMNFTDIEQSIYSDGELEWWWDPYLGEPIPSAERKIWELIITIPETDAFIQEGTSDDPVIYWLDVYVEVEDGEFGWKTTQDHLIDDAVYYLNDDPYWFELRYPFPHPREGDSIDLACGIIGKTTPPLIVDLSGFYDFLIVDAIIINPGNLTYYSLSWSMTVTGELFWPTSPATSNDTIDKLEPNEEVTIKSPPLLGLGPIEIQIKVGNQEPTIFKGFLLLFIILYLQ